MSFSTYSQTISPERIKRANELIIKGKQCDSVQTNLVAQIASKNVQINQLEAIRSIQDSIIFNVNEITINKDSIVFEKIKVIEAKDKEIKKLKRKNLLIIIGSIAVKVLMIAILI